MNINRRAFLDMIAFSEIGPGLLAVSDNGYNVIVGSTADKPILFDSYKEHPRRLQSMIIKGKEVKSDAAGRYQFMGRYWQHYQKTLSLPDFGPESQDKWAICLIGECVALPLVDQGRFPQAVEACRSRWASFPGAGYNQHENEMDNLRMAYTKAGGVVA